MEICHATMHVIQMEHLRFLQFMICHFRVGMYKLTLSNLMILDSILILEFIVINLTPCFKVLLIFDNFFDSTNAKKHAKKHAKNNS